MLNCKQTSHLLSQSLDRKLSRRERFAIRLHLMMCRYCRRFEKQIIALRKGFKQLTQQIESDQNVKMAPEAKARIADAIKSSK